MPSSAQKDPIIYGSPVAMTNEKTQGYPHLPRLIAKPRKKHKMGNVKGGGTQVADLLL